MTTVLAFVAAIAVLVVFHEFGHYWVARRCGVKVLRFSVGFGKVIYSRRLAGNDTEWVISAIPLGGYVKMVDEREDKVAPEDLPYAFNRKPVLQRMAIVVAGPLANFLLAILLYWALFMHGVPGLKPVLGEVPPASLAAAAGMQAGETIVNVEGEPVPSWQELRWRLLELALRQDSVMIEGRSNQGRQLFHQLELSGLEVKDLEGEFLEKLGIYLYQIPVIKSVTVDGVAQRAGLQEGDQILRANGVAMQNVEKIIEVIRAHPEQSVHFDIQRSEMILTIAVMPRAEAEAGKTVGKIDAGISIDQTALKKLLTEVRYGLQDAMTQSFHKTWETTIVSLRMLGKMVMGEVSMKNLSGPITIADYAGQSAAMGLGAYIGFLAFISISLGVLNLLPIPVLDGGHLLYYAAELVKGSPVSERAWEIGQNIGIALIGTLMVFAIYNDINRLVSG